MSFSVVTASPIDNDKIVIFCSLCPILWHQMRRPESTLGSIDHATQVGGICSVIQKTEDMDLEELEGQIESVVHTNEENGCTVARVCLLDAVEAKPGTEWSP